MQHIMTLRKLDNKTQLKCIRTNFTYLLDIRNMITKIVCYMIWDQYIIENKYV